MGTDCTQPVESLVHRSRSVTLNPEIDNEPIPIGLATLTLTNDIYWFEGHYHLVTVFVKNRFFQVKKNFTHLILSEITRFCNFKREKTTTYGDL